MALDHSAESVHAYRARWILPLDAEPIENGVIEVTAGRISALHDRHDPRAIDLGNSAIVPGLVNAHVHLEFSNLTNPLGPADRFTDWIRAVVNDRRGRQVDTAELVRRGRRECQLAGTTALAEITTDETSVSALAEFGPVVCALREVIGLLPEQIEPQFEAARRFLDAQEVVPTHVHRGLSPHAPYSVHPELFRRLVDLAAQRRALVAVHLAETRAELELLNCGTGPFVEMLRQFGVWSENAIPRGSRPIDSLRGLARLDRALVVHGNYLDDAELDFVARHPCLTVVYCPRTHAYFGHDAHPWLELMERGGAVAIGTDSRASNPDLSLWRELCFLRERFPQIEPQTLLRLGTANGAQALGLDSRDWSLETGGAANLTVVNLDATDRRNPYDGVLDNRCSISRTMNKGRWFE